MTRLDNHRICEEEAELASRPVGRWFIRSSQLYWSFATHVAEFFPATMAKVKSRNPFVSMGKLLFLFIAGMIIVTPLFVVLGPIVQIILIIIAIIWTCVLGLLGRNKPSIAKAGEVAKVQVKRHNHVGQHSTEEGV